MAKVFIVNKGVHDYSDAERFGELVYLSEGEMNKFATSNMVRTFKSALDKSSPDDYLITTGLTIMSCLACSLLASLHGKLNLLIYKASRKGGAGNYIERRHVFKSIKGGKEDE